MKQAPKNPAELLVIEPDGARYRTNEADKRKKRKEGDTSKATPADCPSEAESGAPAADDGITPRERDRGWPAGPDHTRGADPPGARTRWAS
ncbi:MAG TPA: hypothetical protein VM492_05610 [Sumerlaeia bacterium]|nr:hypothetical protein [Sumerlaeia bacterium]